MSVHAIVANFDVYVLVVFYLLIRVVIVFWYCSVKYVFYLYMIKHTVSIIISSVLHLLHAFCSKRLLLKREFSALFVIALYTSYTGSQL